MTAADSTQSLRAGTTTEQSARRIVNVASQLVDIAQPTPTWVLVCLALTPIMMSASWVIAGILQAAPYDPMRQTVSVLAGEGAEDRWIVTAGVVAVGLCYLLASMCLSGLQSPARLGLVIAAIAAFGIAANPVPVRGSSLPHAVWATVGGLAIAVWPALACEPGSDSPATLGVRGCRTVTAVFVGLLLWTMVETHVGARLGLAERLTTTIEISWPFVVGATLRRARPDLANVAAARPELETCRSSEIRTVAG